jgi:hypothetical protein
MPRKNTKSLNTNVTPQQIAALQKVYQGNVAELLRQLLRQFVEQRGGEWPALPQRGKHERK